MATSRRRERELARRRFERRRQQELARQERLRARNRKIAQIGGVAVVLLGILFLILGLTGVFSGSPAKVTAAPAGSPTASPTASASPTPAPAAPTKCAAISPNPPAAGEPKVTPVTGAPPTTLVSKDLTVGSGAVAKAGQKVTVKYVGISCSTGKVFDASYTDGAANKEFAFTLGQGQVIKGWDQGVAGMKVGGTRELVIPPSLGYGAAGAGTSIRGNEVLIFVITLDKV